MLPADASANDRDGRATSAWAAAGGGRIVAEVKFDVEPGHVWPALGCPQILHLYMLRPVGGVSVGRATATLVVSVFFSALSTLSRCCVLLGSVTSDSRTVSIAAASTAFAFVQIPFEASATVPSSFSELVWGFAAFAVAPAALTPWSLLVMSAQQRSDGTGSEVARPSAEPREKKCATALSPAGKSAAGSVPPAGSLVVGVVLACGAAWPGHVWPALGCPQILHLYVGRAVGDVIVGRATLELVVSIGRATLELVVFVGRVALALVVSLSFSELSTLTRCFLLLGALTSSFSELDFASAALF